MSDQDEMVWELGHGVSMVVSEEGSVSLIGPASSGDIECMEIPQEIVELLAGKLFAASMARTMRSWQKQMREMRDQLIKAGRLSARDEQDPS